MPAIVVWPVSPVLPDKTQSRASALLQLIELRRQKQLSNKISKKRNNQPINLAGSALAKTSPNFFQLLATFHPIGYG
ncbi:hypothetical protein [Pseudomonas abietaniphila]|uniref:hypothetical protein n=1 Tax=Pseudomonas abietaniphila TaxID=89065 RepID=UPI000B1CB1C9|nr:hypothetical protein [Pseudomonas abietaniphila]